MTYYTMWCVFTALLIIGPAVDAPDLRISLFANTTNPCYSDTVDLICRYPGVIDQDRYSVNTPSWRMNETPLYHDGDVFNLTTINQTASRFRVRIDPATFTGDPVIFTCYLHLNGGEEESNITVVDPQDEAEPPIFADPSVNSTSVRVTWNHTNKGPCFSNLTFSYNITWYPVEKPQGKQRNVTKPGATEYNITNLESKTDYRVELVGFTDSEPPVYSKMAMVDFKTEASDDSSDHEGMYTILYTILTIFIILTVGVTVTVLALVFVRCIVKFRERYFCTDSTVTSEKEIEKGYREWEEEKA